MEVSVTANAKWAFTIIMTMFAFHATHFANLVTVPTVINAMTVTPGVLVGIQYV